MDSLSKLKSDVIKTLENDSWDIDVNINMASSDIKYWCEEHLRILKNIEETSISPSHKLERKKNLINEVLNLKK